MPSSASSNLPSITLLSSNGQKVLKFRQTAGTEAARTHDQWLHRSQCLFPRQVGSFFSRADNPRPQTGKRSPTWLDGGEIPASFGPRNGPNPNRPCRVGNIVQWASARDSSAGSDLWREAA